MTSLTKSAPAVLHVSQIYLLTPLKQFPIYLGSSTILILYLTGFAAGMKKLPPYIWRFKLPPKSETPVIVIQHEADASTYKGFNSCHLAGKCCVKCSHSIRK
jgi:succinate dehydrogenase/fumarate reductase-like Fe-S protein